MIVTEEEKKIFVGKIKRLMVKGVLWELLGILVLFLLTGSLKISFLYVLIRIALYPIYHLIWKKINLWKEKPHANKM